MSRNGCCWETEDDTIEVVCGEFHYLEEMLHHTSTIHNPVYTHPPTIVPPSELDNHKLSTEDSITKVDDKELNDTECVKMIPQMIQYSLKKVSNKYQAMSVM